MTRQMARARSASGFFCAPASVSPAALGQRRVLLRVREGQGGLQEFDMTLPGLAPRVRRRPPDARVTAGPIEEGRAVRLNALDRYPPDLPLVAEEWTDGSSLSDGRSHIDAPEEGQVGHVRSNKLPSPIFRPTSAAGAVHQGMGAPCARGMVDPHPREIGRTKPIGL
jgi:hypothetical protein